MRTSDVVGESDSYHTKFKIIPSPKAFLLLYDRGNICSAYPQWCVIYDKIFRGIEPFDYEELLYLGVQDG
jgi:hypothetical protein